MTQISEFQVAWMALLLLLMCDSNAQPVSDEILVTAPAREAQRWEEATGAVDVVATREQLPGLRFDVAEILAGIPGVQADSRSNFAQDTRITLRGFGARSAFGVRGIDLRLDGIPLASPDGQSQSSVFMGDTIARAEVLRGPVATLYGNGAGGVIALHSAVPEISGARLLLGGGPDGQARYRLAGDYAAGDHAARLQVSRFEGDGFRPHSHATREQLGGVWFYRGDKLAVTARLDISRDPYSEDPQGLILADWQDNPAQTVAAAELFNTHKTVDHRQLSLSATRRLERGQWRLSGWAGQRDINQWLAFPGSEATAGGGIVDLDKSFGGVTGEYQRPFLTPLGSLDLTLGVELEKMQDDRRGYVNQLGVQGDLRRNEVGEVTARDGFVGLLWQPAPAWRIQAGGRYSRVGMVVDDDYINQDNPDDSGSLKFAEPSWALGVNYDAGAWHWFASTGEGFETPTLTEIAYRNDATGLNPLEAAHNRQLETGLRWQNDAWRLSAAVYRIASTDELVVDRSDGGRTTYRNAAETRREGLEWLSVWQSTDHWRWRLSGNWLDAHYSAGEFAGKHLPGVAKASVYSQWDWLVYGNDAAVLTLVGNYRSRMATGDANDEYAPAATVWHLGASTRHRWGAIELEGWARINNMTDRQAVGSVIVNQSRGRTIEPAPGREIQFGIEWGYNW